MDADFSQWPVLQDLQEEVRRLRASEIPEADFSDTGLMDTKFSQPPLLQDLQEQRRRFRASEIPETDFSSLPLQQAVNPGILPSDSYNRLTTYPKDALQEKLDSYHKKDFTLTGINPRFVGLPDLLSVLLPPTRHDFTDQEYLHRTAIEIFKLEDSSIAAIGRVVIPMFSYGFSKYGAACLFVMAAHSKKPSSKFLDYLLPEVFELNSFLIDTKLDCFSKDIVSPVSAIEELPHCEDVSREASFYSYISLCAMRLFSKSAVNFTRAWHHIARCYSNFYGDNVVTNIPTASQTAVEGLRNYFTLDERYKMTLFRILYAANAEESHEGIKKFSFDLHLSNTGLHIMSCFSGLIRAFNCNTKVLMSLIYTPLFAPQMNGINKFVELMTNRDEKYRRGMWRYGRIFDESFMSELQTKRCPLLVYVLAAALKIVSPDTHKNILNIVQFQDVGQDDRRKAQKAAEKLVMTMRS